MRHGLLAGIFLACLASAWALTPDATREQVIAELGKPTSVAKLGAREILIYPKGVRLELENGKVVSVKGIDLTDTETVPGQTPAATQKKNEERLFLAEKEKQQAAEAAAVKQAYGETKETGQTAMDKMIEGEVKDHENAQQPPPPKKFNVIGFVLGVILKFLFTVAALKVACKYWGAEVFWSVILTVAGVDSLVSGIMNLVGELVLGFPTLFSADDLVGGIVMLFLLKNLSVNHAIGQAIQLTLTTKTFIVVAGLFLITAIVRLLT